MSGKFVVGYDGSVSSRRALEFAVDRARAQGGTIVLAHVLEWSPYSFQTAEENALRHKRREEEIATAMERIVTPAVTRLTEAGLSASGMVRHGNVADTLNAIAVEEGATQIVVARSTEGGFTKRIFGSATANLVMEASVPVTVVT